MISKTNFLFVNKTSESSKLTQSQGSERSKIFSHVQRLSPDHAGASTSEAWQVYRSPKDWTLQTASDYDASTGHCSEHTLQSCRVKAKSRKTRAKKLSERQLLPQILLTQRLVGASGDPFHCHKVSFTPRVQYLLRVYDSDIAPLLFPIESVAAPSRDYTLSLALEDPFMHHALLSSVLTRMYSCTKRSSHHILAMSSKQKALAYLQSLISTANGDRIDISYCYGISMLIWIECLIGNYGDLRAHASGLQFLLPCADNVYSIPIYLIRIIYACAHLCTVFLDVPPPAQVNEAFGEPEVSLGAKAIMKTPQVPALNGAGHLFFTPSNSKILGPALVLIAVELQEAVLLRKMFSADPKCEQSKADIEFVCAREASIERDILSLRYSSTLSPPQNAIRLSMFICSTLPLIAAMGSSAALSQILAKQMRQDIEHGDLSTSWASSLDLLLWVLVIGAFVSYGEEEWHWFQTRIFALMDELGVVSVSDTESRLSGYFCSKYLLKTIRVIWSEYECWR